MNSIVDNLSHIKHSNSNSNMVLPLAQILGLLMVMASSCNLQVAGHGRLLEPPARNTLWRFGFKAPPNYNDNELFCGGIGGIVRNQGKCGVCGDPFDSAIRLHETGAPMALNVTTRSYFPGSSLDLMVEIVANHGGTFEFAMCWRDSFDQPETEACFEPLKLTRTPSELYPPEVELGHHDHDHDHDHEQDRDHSHGHGHSIHTNSHTHSERDYTGDYGKDTASTSGDQDDATSLPETHQADSSSKFELNANRGTGFYSMSVELPANRTCESCVLRWHWRSANNWGTCSDGSQRVGCGHQEIYRNCADVSVKRNGAGIGLSRRRR